MILSKSRYLAGVQCPKRLWIETNAPGLVPAADEATQARFDEGSDVGRLARTLFPGGLEIDPDTRLWARLVDGTRRALRQRVPLYEAAFTHEGGGCRVDLLVPVENGAWDLYEVKSSTSVKEVHLDDVAFQSWVVRGAGIALRRAHVVHVDTSYVRGEAIDVAGLFKIVDVTGEAAERERAVPERLRELQRVRALGAMPEIGIGTHCSAPYDCPLVPYCWRHVPEESVFTLRRGTELAWRLYGHGIRELVDVPEGAPLTAGQKLQVEVARSRRPHVDRAALRRFLGTLVPPVGYLDFESFSLGVPPYPGTRPYQQIPFQFSFQVADGDVGAPRISRKAAFLAEDGSDPRRRFLERLREELDAIGSRGSIVVYHAAFERGRIAEATSGDAELEAWAAALSARLVDLIVPFRSLDYYHPEQRGSASLKAVLPILGRRGYEELAIQDGAFAAREFLRSVRPELPPEERAAIREALLAYCARDTEGMVEIVAALGRLADAGG